MFCGAFAYAPMGKSINIEWHWTAFGRKAQNYETINYAFCACISMAHGTLNMALEKRKTMRSAPPWRMALYF